MMQMDLRIGAAPRFLITIDTEGDNLWSMPAAVTTANARFLPRFQTLCESHRLKPTYLTDYQMARCGDFRAFGRAVLDRQTAEIGMHLHAWDTPPLIPLTPNDCVCQPYLIEYPLEAMRDKIRLMTDLLEDVFATKMVSHRAGRWGFNEAYARILVEHGYQVDCSVTPHWSWQMQKGNPLGNGGPDYRGFPDRAYFVDLDDISRPGDSALLELPLTIIQPRSRSAYCFIAGQRAGQGRCDRSSIGSTRRSSSFARTGAILNRCSESCAGPGKRSAILSSS